MSYEVITVKYFCVRHKNRWKHNQHLILDSYIPKNLLHLLQLKPLSDENAFYFILKAIFVFEIFKLLF